MSGPTAGGLTMRLARAIYEVAPVLTTNGHGDTVAVDFEDGGVRKLFAVKEARACLDVIDEYVETIVADAALDAEAALRFGAERNQAQAQVMRVRAVIDRHDSPALRTEQDKHWDPLRVQGHRRLFDELRAALNGAES